MPFRYLEDVAPADVAFEAEAATAGALFAEAWTATLSLMIEDPASIEAEVSRRVTLAESEPDLLLFDFLGLLLRIKDAERLLLRVESIEVAPDPSGSGWTLEARLSGERIEPGRGGLGIDVKAVTMHRLEVTEEAGVWRATVVLDV